MFSCCAVAASTGEVIEVSDVVIEAPAPEPKAPEPEPVEEAPSPEPKAPEPAPVEEAPKAAPKPSLVIEFADEAQATQIIELSDKPLGISFANTMPLTVKRVDAGGRAEKLGVMPGWVFTKIAGEAVNGDTQYADVIKMLKRGMEPLEQASGADNFPPGSLVIEFATVAGFTKKLAFTKKPLGLSFDKAVPLVVKKVTEGSQAAELNVAPGWEFKNIGGKDLTNMHYDAITQLIQVGTVGLP